MRLCFYSLFCVGLASASPVKRWYANTENGQVNGVQLPNFDQDIFLGIPYAIPPTPDNGLRFSNPVPYNQSFPAGGYDAFQYSASCPQYGPFAVGTAASDNQSEDCLTLNVIRPAGGLEGLPVLVWIYGGGYTAGATSDPVYNLSYIVRESQEMGQPIIAVSMNYRTAIFGFIASEEVMRTGNTNIGIKDQRLALQWIKRNIAGFGGDPEQITIWGESAGAYSVGLQVLAYGGQQSGLFRGAIYESGTALATYQNLDHYDPIYQSIVNSTGCNLTMTSALDCLRALPFEVIYNVSGSFGFTPIIDGDLIPDWPSELLRTGQFDTEVASLIGANSDEGTATFFGWAGLNTDAEMVDFLSNNTETGLNISSSTAESLVAAYSDDPLLGAPYGISQGINLTALGKLYKKSASIAGDLFIIAPRRYQCEVVSGHGTPTFSYRFDQAPYKIPAFIQGTLPNNPTHYSEISFVFGNPANLTDPYEMYLGPAMSGNQKLSSKMMRAWISFAANLDPNHDQLGVTWSDYRDCPANIVFSNTGVYMEKDDFRSEGISILNSNPLDLLH